MKNGSEAHRKYRKGVYTRQGKGATNPLKDLEDELEDDYIPEGKVLVLRGGRAPREKTPDPSGTS